MVFVATQRGRAGPLHLGGKPRRTSIDSPGRPGQIVAGRGLRRCGARGFCGRRFCSQTMTIPHTHGKYANDDVQSILRFVIA